MLEAEIDLISEGCLYSVFRVFPYLKQMHIKRLIFDPTYPKIAINKLKPD
jgi:hypothetical protein